MIKRNIYLLCAISLLQGMVFYAPVATLYRQAAGLGIFHITLIESISFLLTILLEIPWGWAADRMGYRRTMVLCCLVYVVSKIIFWQAAGFGGFLLERLLLSIVCAGLSGVDSSMLFLSCGEENSHRVFGIYNNAGELGMLAAALIYAVWIQEDYRLAAFLTVLTYGLAAVLSLGLQEVSPKKSSPAQSAGREMLGTLKQQLANRNLLLLLLSAALLSQVHQSVTVFLNQLQYTRSGMSHRGISAAFLLVSLAGLTGTFSARGCAVFGAGRMGTGLFLVSSLSCLLMAVLPIPWLSVLAVLLLRTAFSLMMPLQTQLQHRLVTTGNRASELSANAVIQDSLGIFLNLLLGYAAEESLTSALLLGSLLCAMGLWFYHQSQRTVK